MMRVLILVFALFFVSPITGATTAPESTGMAKMFEEKVFPLFEQLVSPLRDEAVKQPVQRVQIKDRAGKSYELRTLSLHDIPQLVEMIRADWEDASTLLALPKTSDSDKMLEFIYTIFATRRFGVLYGIHQLDCSVKESPEEARSMESAEASGLAAAGGGGAALGVADSCSLSASALVGFIQYEARAESSEDPISLSPEVKRFEMGYYVQPSVRKQGVMSAALLRSILELKREFPKLNELTARVIEGNDPSILLLEKFGFKKGDECEANDQIPTKHFIFTRKL